ncbi:MAG: helix-turn-helix domain-containing protein, partial [Gemmatimonadota bacterium]
MADRHPEVGARILELRQERGLSLRALAEVSGLSLNAISRIERGESSPTVSSLQLLASALEVPMLELFRVEPQRTTVLVRADERARTRGAGVLIESLGSGLPGQHMGPFMLTLEPGASASDEAITHGGEEFVHCVQGRAEYRVGEEWYELCPGDSLLFQAPQRHMCRNPGRKPA